MIYVVHTLFWSAFAVAGLFLRFAGAKGDPSAAAKPLTPAPQTARFSRLVLAVHFLAFGLIYFGLSQVVLAGLVPVLAFSPWPSFHLVQNGFHGLAPEWFPGQPVIGTAVITLGAALMVWARVYFHSWRFRAKIDSDHVLATGGPFRYLRNPIYQGLNFLALGTAIWYPTTVLWVAFGVMVFGSDLRARAEEKVLAQSFGQPYLEYSRRTRRFVPGLY